MNKANRTPPLSSVSTDKLPQMFSYFFCEKVSTIQHNINSCVSCAPTGLVDQLFSGDPLTQFSAVSETAVSALLKKMAPKSCDLYSIHSISFDCSDEIQFSKSVWNLGMIFNGKLLMKQQFSKVCQSTYLELCRIRSVRHVLTDEATKALVTSLVLSRLD